MTVALDPPIVLHPKRSLVRHVQSILLQPRADWPIIAAEPATTTGLYLGYIGPLAAIPPAAALIGRTVLGIGMPFGGTYRVPFGSALISALVQYVVALVGVYGLALIIDGLAPAFGGARGRVQALKVAAYASTASWIAGIVGLVPALGILGLVGIYSLYLIYLGLPAVMKAPPERAVGYAATVIACAIGLFLVTGAIASRFIAYPVLSLPVR